VRTLAVERWCEQASCWPVRGRHILAHHTATSIVLYHAFAPQVAAQLIASRRFDALACGASGTSWFKVGFLSMMHHCGWGTQSHLERVLALRTSRAWFNELLQCAVPTAPDPGTARARAEVQFQWDADHDPAGAPLPRRALQLGLRGEALRRFGRWEVLEVIDLTDFIATQRKLALAGELERITLPRERLYSPARESLGVRLGVTTPSPNRCAALQ
jgi:hypothetical protein